MRLYTFTHFMLSPMAKGIQATHSTVELFNKYSKEYPSGQKLYDWSKNHKTMVSLNGGITPDLHNLVEFLEYGNCPYPWAYFKEDESLGELMTSISLVLPEKIYEIASMVKKGIISYSEDDIGFEILVPEHEYFKVREEMELIMGNSAFTTFDYEMISLLNTYRLASV